MPPDGEEKTPRNCHNLKNFSEGHSTTTNNPANMTTDQIIRTSSHQYGYDETIELPQCPNAYREGKNLVLENGAELISNRCVKSGRRVKKKVKVSPFNPLVPTSWFRSRTKVNIGLSRRQFECFLILKTLAWSLLGLGAVMIGLDLFAGGNTMIAGGVLLTGGTILRTFYPVWIDSRGDCVVVHGCGESFLDLFSDQNQQGYDSSAFQLHNQPGVYQGH
jgi:hypothetical protein